MKAQPSSPAVPSGPACSKCHRTTRFHSAPHSHGWQIRAWCESCQCDAIPGHPWWPKKRFAAEELAALEPLPEVRSTQLSLLDPANGNDGRDR